MKYGGMYDLWQTKRFARLLKRDFLISYRGILIAAAAVAGFIILVSVLTNLGRRGGFEHLTLFAPLLFLGGFAVASLSFRELHQGEKSYFYLNLPTSVFEKLVSKLLVTSIGFAVGAVIFYSLASLTAEAVNRLIFGYGHRLFNPVDRDVLLAAAVFLVTQSIFLVGSAYFRKLAFLKTVVAWNVLAIGTAVIGGLIIWLLFRGTFLENGKLVPEVKITIDALADTGRLDARLESMNRGFWITFKVLFWAVLAPVCWTVTYYRLRETEV